MTERVTNLADIGVRPSYEQLRDSASGEAATAWQAADRELSKLHNLYRELKQDERYQEEYKAQQAWAAYENAKDRIIRDKEKTREALVKQARTAERFSIPMPDQEALTTNDASKLLASQNEASRIVRRIDRLESSPKGKGGPFTPDRAEVLREEYGRGLEVGGVQGGAICRGALSAAAELGVDTEAVVDQFRKPRHRDSLERAQHAQRLRDLISKQVPEPPFAKPGQRRRGSEPLRRASNTFLAPKEAPLIKSGAARRRPWK